MRGGPTKEQQERAARRHAHKLKWNRANRLRANWTSEQRQAEAERLESEIRQKLARIEAEKQDRKAA